MTYDMTATLMEDGTVRWWGMDTGRTEVVAKKEREGIIAFYIAGHKYWAGRGDQAYAPAQFKVCRYKLLKMDGPREVISVEFFGGLLGWNARRPWQDE